jgi:hypothetical protein
MVLAGTERHGITVELQRTKAKFLSAMFIQNVHTCSNSQRSRETEQLAAMETHSAPATLHTAVFLLSLDWTYT